VKAGCGKSASPGLRWRRLETDQKRHCVSRLPYGKTHSPIRLNEDCDAFDLNFSARSYKISEINEQDLINNPKPFSLIILALYYRLKTSEWKLSNKINTRHTYFKQLILSAYTKVTDEDDLLLFIYCINCILELPQSDQVNIINTVLERFNVSYTTKEYEKLAKMYFLPGYTERMKAEGIAEGEAKTLAQTVYNFDDHKEKFSDEFISEVTGLSIKEILEFRARRPPKN
jgi:hypothetical protein